MSDNPYAPPTAEVEDPSRGPFAGTGDFSIAQCLADGWAALTRHFGTWLGGFLLLFLAAGLSGITVIGIFLVWPVLAYGGVVLVMNTHDGNPSVRDAWRGFERYGHTLATGLGLVILISVVSYLGQIPMLVAQFMADANAAALALMGLAWVVAMLWNVVVLSRLNFAWFLWVEQNDGPVDALSRSWQITSPAKWKLMALVLLLMVIGGVGTVVALPVLFLAAAVENVGAVILAIAAMAIPFVGAMVLGYLLFVSAYRQMFGRPGAAT